MPDAVAAHNLHALGWWLIEVTIRGEIEKDRAATVVSAMRILVSLGDEPPSSGDLRDEGILRARLAFGMPPATDEEWEMAERLLDPATLREVRRQVDVAGRRARGEMEGLDVPDGGDGA